jgi:hypothetical protein
MKVELNDETLPKGTELFVNDLGALVNGESVEIDEAAVEAFELRTGTTVAEALKGDERIKVSGPGSQTTAKTEDKKKEGGE